MIYENLQFLIRLIEDLKLRKAVKRILKMADTGTEPSILADLDRVFAQLDEEYPNTISDVYREMP